MSLHNILIATGIVAAVGLIIAIVLSIAEKAFHVDVDEKEVAVRECLAGNNCGACGYAGCDALAKAIAQGAAPAQRISAPKPLIITAQARALRLSLRLGAAICLALMAAWATAAAPMCATVKQSEL